MSRPRSNRRTLNVGVNALARELNLPQSTVSKKMREGATAADIRRYAAAHGKVPVKKAAEPDQGEYEMLLRTRSKLEAIEDAKLRRAEALAVRQELENMQKRAELIPTAYVKKWGAHFLIEARNEMLRGPSELADQLVGQEDARVIEQVLRGWVDRVMGKFTNIERLWAKIKQEDQKVA